MIPNWMRNPVRLKNLFSMALCSSAALLSLTSTAHANLIADSGFESAGTGATYFAGQYIDSSNSWKVTLGSVYIDSNDPWVYADNNSLNLTYPNDYATDSVQQTLATTAGQFYRISFYANSDSPNSFSVTENGLSIAGLPTSIVDNGFPDPTSNSSLFVLYNGSFIANSSSTILQFSAQADPSLTIGYTGGDSVMIDNVSVITPEPSSLVLMFTGLAGLGFAAGRKRFATSL